MKKIITAALTAGMALSLVACADGGSPSTDSDAGKTEKQLYERTIELTDGRTITCVIYSSSQQGGLSCDWSAR